MSAPTDRKPASGACGRSGAVDAARASITGAPPRRAAPGQTRAPAQAPESPRPRTSPPGPRASCRPRSPLADRAGADRVGLIHLRQNRLVRDECRMDRDVEPPGLQVHPRAPDLFRLLRAGRQDVDFLHPADALETEGGGRFAILP